MILEKFKYVKRKFILILLFYLSQVILFISSCFICIKLFYLYEVCLIVHFFCFTGFCSFFCNLSLFYSVWVLPAEQVSFICNAEFSKAGFLSFAVETLAQVSIQHANKTNNFNEVKLNGYLHQFCSFAVFSFICNQTILHANKTVYLFCSFNGKLNLRLVLRQAKQI